MHEVQLWLFSTNSGAHRRTENLTDEEFVKTYVSGEFAGYKILSMLWTHKNETHKLIFGD